MTDERIAAIRKKLEDELLLFHPELRTALISNEQRVKLACVLEVMVRETVEELMANCPNTHVVEPINNPKE